MNAIAIETVKFILTLKRKQQIMNLHVVSLRRGLRIALVYIHYFEDNSSIFIFNKLSLPFQSRRYVGSFNPFFFSS